MSLAFLLLVGIGVGAVVAGAIAYGWAASDRRLLRAHYEPRLRYWQRKAAGRARD